MKTKKMQILENYKGFSFISNNEIPWLYVIASEDQADNEIYPLITDIKGQRIINILQARELVDSLYN